MTPIELQTPYGSTLRYTVERGEQTIIDNEVLCRRAAERIDARAWSSAMSSSGWIVDTADRAVGEKEREIFALRFRRPGIYGDLVSYPGISRDLEYPKCRRYILRLQRSRHENKPDPWRTEFYLSVLFEDEIRYMINTGEKRTPLFAPTPDFPAGYP